MIAVILAAGMSRRLHPLTKEKPKCLLSVGELTILSRYLKLLEQRGVGKTIIVNGFNYEAVENEVRAISHKMQIDFVTNYDYETTHPIESFLLSEPFLNDDFLLLNSDIYFTEYILRALIEFPESCVAIDSKAEYEKGEMFVNFEPSTMRVTAISKLLSKLDAGQGKSIQIAKFLYRDKKTLFDRARELSSKTEAFYPAQAYDTLIDQKRFYAVDVAGEFSHELDTPEDYESLLSYISSHKTL